MEIPVAGEFFQQSFVPAVSSLPFILSPFPQTTYLPLSSTGPGPSLLVTHRLPSCRHRHRSGVEQRSWGWGGGLSAWNPPYLHYLTARPLHLCLHVFPVEGGDPEVVGPPVKRDPHRPSKQQAGLPEEVDRHSGGTEASEPGSSGNETALRNNEGGHSLNFVREPLFDCLHCFGSGEI